MKHLYVNSAFLNPFQLVESMCSVEDITFVIALVLNPSAIILFRLDKSTAVVTMVTKPCAQDVISDKEKYIQAKVIS